MFPERQTGQTTRALCGLTFSDNREALKGFEQGSIKDLFSGEITKVAKMAGRQDPVAGPEGEPRRLSYC